MYYSSGNYEAFARPKKPEGVERKSAYEEKMLIQIKNLLYLIKVQWK